MKTPTCGLYVASSSACACLLSPEGAVIASGTFTTSPGDLQKLLKLLPPRTPLFLESTGHYHQFWARELTSAGHPVYLLNALLAKRLQPASSALRQNKTDPGDARNLAETGRLHGDQLAQALWREDPANDATRVLGRTRARQRSQLTDTLKAAQNLLGRLLPEARFLKLAQNERLTRFLLTVRSLAHLRGLRLATLEEHVGKHAEELHRLLHLPLNAAGSFDHQLPALKAELHKIESLRAGQVRLDDAIEEATATAGRSAQVRLARTVPGIGLKTAPVLVAALPRDLRALGTKREVQRKIQALLGCDPRTRESGKFKGRKRMTKRGDPVARTALFQAASCAVMHDETMKAHYDREKALGKAHRVAVSHIMRRVLWRLVAVLYDAKDFISITLETTPKASSN